MFSIAKIFESMTRPMAHVIASGSKELPEPPSFRRKTRVLENRWAEERRAAARGEGRGFCWQRRR